jgi:hypothetical protein
MKYHKITWKETNKTEECSSFKTACKISGLNYQSQLNLRSKQKVKTIDHKNVRIEQLQMRK